VPVSMFSDPSSTGGKPDCPLTETAFDGRWSSTSSLKRASAPKSAWSAMWTRRQASPAGQLIPGSPIRR
jgi:hypothetical protein